MNKSVTQNQLLLVSTVAGKVYRDKAGLVVGALGVERDYVEDQYCLLGRDEGDLIPTSNQSNDMVVHFKPFLFLVIFLALSTHELFVSVILEV